MQPFSGRRNALVPTGAGAAADLAGWRRNGAVSEKIARRGGGGATGFSLHPA